MSEYSKKELEKIRKLLEREKKNSLKQLSAISADDPFADPDRLVDNAASDTEAKEETGHERAEALKKELTEKISRIDAAITLIDSGEYGKCQSCGQPIDISRLKIMPTATLCVDCERNREEKAF